MSRKDDLEIEVAQLKLAILELNKQARDVDDNQTGDPRHCHSKRGHWDKDGSVCLSCKAWNDALKLARKKS